MCSRCPTNYRSIRWVDQIEANNDDLIKLLTNYPRVLEIKLDFEAARVLYKKAVQLLYQRDNESLRLVGLTGQIKLFTTVGLLVLSKLHDGYQRQSPRTNRRLTILRVEVSKHIVAINRTESISHLDILMTLRTALWTICAVSSGIASIAWSGNDIRCSHLHSSMLWSQYTHF